MSKTDRNARKTAMAMSIAETGRMNGRSRRMRARMQNHRSTNPIFGKDPEEALAIARALGAVQEPGEEEGRRLRAFLALARLRTPAVTRLYRQGETGPITTISITLRYRIGTVVVEWNADVSLPGQSVTDAQSPDELIAFVSASLYVPEHPHHSSAACRRCQTPRLAGLEPRESQVLEEIPLVKAGAGIRMCGPPLTTNVGLTVLRHFPEFVEEVAKLARETAWQAAKEKEKDKEVER